VLELVLTVLGFLIGFSPGWLVLLLAALLLIYVTNLLAQHQQLRAHHQGECETRVGEPAVFLSEVASHDDGDLLLDPYEVLLESDYSSSCERVALLAESATAATSTVQHSQLAAHTKQGHHEVSPLEHGLLKAFLFYAQCVCTCVSECMCVYVFVHVCVCTWCA
jgi:hypothetical protein